MTEGRLPEMRDPFWPGCFTAAAQRQAQLAVARAVEDGRLDPPTDHPRLECGARCPACLVEYHHVGGCARAAWLCVVALCRRHQRLAHARLEQPLPSHPAPPSPPTGDGSAPLRVRSCGPGNAAGQRFRPVRLKTKATPAAAAAAKATYAV